MQIEKFMQKMSDGTEISVNRWIPEEKEIVKAVVVFSHGMQEHALRYDRIGSEFALHGFVFSAHDHRGHGKTAYCAENNKTGMFGKLADKDGFTKATNDIAEIIGEIKKDYPNKKVILMSHSFGSLLAQNYIEQHGSEIDGCILSGTSGPNSKAFWGSLLASTFCLFLGSSYKSNFLQNIAFSSYNNRFKDENDSISWLSKNQANRIMYKNDSWCGGVSTVSFFKDISNGLLKIHKTKNIQKIPQNLPIYAFCGSDDPVGNYGKSVEKLVNLYKKSGIKNVSLKIYKDDRHEVLNENDGDQAVQDIFNWIEKNICL